MNEFATLTQADGLSLSQEDREKWKANIVKGIELLSKNERLVLALHFHEELSIAEVSLVLEISEEEVAKTRSVIVKKLLR